MHCPKCTILLERIEGDPNILCGGVNYYRCLNPTCEIIWKEDQSGITSQPTNLTEVPKHEAALILKSI